MEVTGSVILGMWKNNKLSRIKIDNFSVESNTEVLREEAISKIENPTNGIELVFKGIICEDGRALSSYGVTPGATIHVLEKKPIIQSPEVRKLSDEEIKQVIFPFKSFKVSRLSSSFRAAIQRFSRPEVLENIIAATPGLADDPVAIAFIKDPELLLQLSNPEIIPVVAEKHPALIEAAHYIAAHVHEEHAKVNPNQASTSSGFSYSLDALSDDEDMEDNGSDGGRDSHPFSMPIPLSRNASYSAITSAQLAAAIANVTNSAFSAGTSGVTDMGTSAAGNSNSTPGTSPAVITSEMFSNAIQQAFASAPFPGNTTTSSFSSPQTPMATSDPSPNEDQSLSSLTLRWRSQLQQMHEMGLSNDSVNVRALQATSGDVQAAVELVFSGVFASNMS